MRKFSDHNVKVGIIGAWAIGMGGALGGDFYGWENLLMGGYFPALGGLILVIIFYWLYSASITDLCARYKTSGGSFDFVNSALGIHAATLMAVLNILRLLLANASTSMAISSYMVDGGLPEHFRFISWIGSYSIFALFDGMGIKNSVSIQIGGTCVCLLVVLFCTGSSFSIFDASNLETIAYPNAGLGFLRGLPFVLQFYSGFEQIPLILGYTHDPDVTIPNAILLCYASISIVAILVLSSNAGAINANDSVQSTSPVMLTINKVYGEGSTTSSCVAFVIVCALYVNFFSFSLYSSQQLQSIAEAGQLPAFLSYRHPTTGAPISAAACTAIAGTITTTIFWLIFGARIAQNCLLSAALFTCLLGYLLVFQCNVDIHKIEKVFGLARRDICRDSIRLGFDPKQLRFVYGVKGARLGQLICLILLSGLIVLTFTSQFNDYLYGLIVIIVLGSGMFGLMIRCTPPETDFDEVITTKDNPMYLLIHPNGIPDLEDYDSIYPLPDDLL